MRIGHGYDAHRFCEGDALTLGGVKIPYEKAFLAHSDGDVLVHALIDALFGAAGESDIGAHFPPSDDQYKGIDSCILLKETADILKEKGFTVEYADMTIVAQKPKLADKDRIRPRNYPGSGECKSDHRGENGLHRTRRRHFCSCGVYSE